MFAYLIEPDIRSVSEVPFGNGGIKKVKDILDCEQYEIAARMGKARGGFDVVYAAAFPAPNTETFRLDGKPIAGVALIVGITRHDVDRTPHISVDDLAARITFDVEV